MVAKTWLGFPTVGGGSEKESALHPTPIRAPGAQWDFLPLATWITLERLQKLRSGR